MNRQLPSLIGAAVAFGLDRIHKFVQVSGDCIALGQQVCVGNAFGFVPEAATGWRGGEFVPVTPFFDYVLVWNTGISYGLLSAVPAWGLGLVMTAALVGLAIWWWRADQPLVRLGLAVAIGGALSNAIDRWIYGAVADFFHLHAGSWSFYIFNIADTAITLGVILLILDLLGIGRKRSA